MKAGTARYLLKQGMFSLVAVILLWLIGEAFVLTTVWLQPNPGTEYRYLYRPHPYSGFAPVPNRIDRAKRGSFNSLGLRGLEIAAVKPPRTIRIVCLGGSTTYSDGATTDSHTYPSQMERVLRDHYRDAPFRIEVINAGVNAHNSLDSQVLFQTTVLDLSPDIAVAHHGLNDCWFFLDFEDFRSDYSHARKTFGFPPCRWWEYSPLLSYLFKPESPTNPYFPPEFVNINIPIVTQPEAIGPKARRRAPDLEPEMLEAFARNTRTFISVARANGVIPVLSTQTVNDDSRTGGRWIQAVGRLNQVTREVGKREGVGVIDFAKEFPWNPKDYYDEIHVKDTPAGMGRQAAIFAGGLIELGVIEQASRRIATP